MILSYAVLAANGKSMTLKEIDAKCEYELYDRFRLKIDFDVEGAMVKLLPGGPRRTEGWRAVHGDPTEEGAQET